MILRCSRKTHSRWSGRDCPPNLPAKSAPCVLPEVPAACSIHDLETTLPLRLITTAESKENDPDSRYERWSKIEHRFGFLVVVGLAVETILAFWMPEPWYIKGVTLLSDFLIVVGVWGEILAGNRARVAGDAIVEEARAKSAAANALAEQSQLERLRLEAKLAPRCLSAEEAKKLRDLLTNFRDTRADVMPFGGGFPEVARTSNILQHILLWSGWSINVVPPPDNSLSLEGIHVGLEQPHDDQVRLAATALVDALNDAGWTAYIWQGPLPSRFSPSSGFLPDVRFFAPIRIMVGFKPDPLNPATGNTDKTKGI